MDRITPPWTAKQTQGLNRWQRCSWVHPFVCGNDHPGDRVLIAGADGWFCPTCDYRQDWAHEFMQHGPPPDPMSIFDDHT